MDKEQLRDLITQQYGGYEGLANEIGVSPQAISEVVNGRTVGASSRYSVAKALGLTVADIWPEALEAEPAPAAQP